MRDGLTRERESSAQIGDEQSYLELYRARLVLVSSPSAGKEYPVDRERLILGRGPGVDLAFDDPDMSRQHARIDCTEDGLCIRDLGSTNGLFVNESAVPAAELQNGDRIQLGGFKFQLVVEARQESPEVYELTVED
jgi:two-component system cell cycle response regulator